MELAGAFANLLIRATPFLYALVIQSIFPDRMRVQSRISIVLDQGTMPAFTFMYRGELSDARLATVVGWRGIHWRRMWDRKTRKLRIADRR